MICAAPGSSLMRPVSPTNPMPFSSGAVGWAKKGGADPGRLFPIREGWFLWRRFPWKTHKLNPPRNVGLVLPQALRRSLQVPLFWAGQNRSELNCAIAREVPGGNAKTVLCASLHSVNTFAKLRHVYIQFNDSLLGEKNLHPDSVVCFQSLSCCFGKRA